MRIITAADIRRAHRDGRKLRKADAAVAHWFLDHCSQPPEPWAMVEAVVALAAHAIVSGHVTAHCAQQLCAMEIAWRLRRLAGQAR